MPDIRRDFQMVISMPKNVKAVIDILEKNGHEAYKIGRAHV